MSPLAIEYLGQRQDTSSGCLKYAEECDAASRRIRRREAKRSGCRVGAVYSVCCVCCALQSSEARCYVLLFALKVVITTLAVTQI